jgi:hypothetical protein
MTAINPARLKIQSAKVAQSFLDPKQLILDLHELFIFYSARIREISLSRSPVGIQAYQIPKPVYSTLELELTPQITQHPEKSFVVIDALWKEDWIEFRQLAVNLLGLIPSEFYDDILERIQDWLTSSPTEELRQQIINKGLRKVAVDKQDQVLAYLETLATRRDQQLQQGALYGLLFFAEDLDFENFPRLFRILGDILLDNKQNFIKEITQIIHTLRKRSEKETANFLVRQLTKASKPLISRITRQVLRDFSDESQLILRQGLNK